MDNIISHQRRYGNRGLQVIADTTYITAMKSIMDTRGITVKCCSTLLIPSSRGSIGLKRASLGLLRLWYQHGRLLTIIDNTDITFIKNRHRHSSQHQGQNSQETLEYHHITDTSLIVDTSYTVKSHSAGQKFFH